MTTLPVVLDRDAPGPLGAQLSGAADTAEAAAADPKFCSIDNPECEACQ